MGIFHQLTLLFFTGCPIGVWLAANETDCSRVMENHHPNTNQHERNNPVAVTEYRRLDFRMIHHEVRHDAPGCR